MLLGAWARDVQVAAARSSEPWSEELFALPIALLFSVSGPSWVSFWGSFGALSDCHWALLGRLGTLLGRLGACWRPLAVLGLSWRPLWALLGACWGSLGALLGSSYDPLGPSWGPVWPSWGPLWQFSGRCGSLYGSWGDLWSLLSRFRPSLDRKGENPKNCPKPFKKQCFLPPRALLGSLLKATWDVLGTSWTVWGPSLPPLERSWAVLGPLGRLWNRLEGILSRLGGVLEVPGAVLGRRSRQLGPWRAR